MADYYELLGVSSSASVEEIRSAYRKRAGVFHPDRNPGDIEVAKKFCEISRAYDILSDQDQRRKYDVSSGRGKSTSLLDSLAADLESALAVFGQVASFFQAPEPKKRSECVTCKGTGQAVSEFGPFVITHSCSDCEVENHSPVNGDRQ